MFSGYSDEPEPEEDAEAEGGGGSVTATILFPDDEDEDTSEIESTSLSSSPQSWTGVGAASGRNSTDHSSLELSGEDDYDDFNFKRPAFTTSFSTTSLSEALEAIGATPTPLPTKTNSLPIPEQYPSRAPLMHSSSDPIKIVSPRLLHLPSFEAEVDKTPLATQFNFSTPTPLKQPFIQDSTPSFSRRSSISSGSSSTSPLTAPLIIPITLKPRPGFIHRKTHSGSFTASTSSIPGGIHKRNPSGTVRLTHRESPTLNSITKWNADDVESLEEHGLKVHDFRTRDNSSRESLVLDVLMGGGEETIEEGGARTPTTKVSPILSHRASLSRNNSGSHSRSSSSASRRHGRTASRSSVASPLAVKAPLLPAPITKRMAKEISGSELLERLKSDDERPLLIVDVRSLSAFLGEGGRVKSSVNVNFPSLLIKRFRKGNTSNFTLSSFITTESGKMTYQSTTRQAQLPGTLDGVDVLVIDQKPESRDPTSTSPGSVLLAVLERREERGTIFYFTDPFPSKTDSQWQEWIVLGEPEDETFSSLLESNPSHSFSSSSSSGLLTLQSQPFSTTTTFSQRTPTFSAPNDLFIPSHAPPSPNLNVSPRTPGGRNRPPKLRRIDTSDDLLGLRGSHLTRQRSKSPVRQSPTTTMNAGGRRAPPPMSIQALCHAQSKSPSTTRFTESEHNSEPPPTARPSFPQRPDSPSSPSSAGNSDVPPFEMSTIIPGFLFLGPEPTKNEDLDQLEEKGVKQVLNLALECEDRNGEIGRRFEKYWKIPMRDFVEETGVQASIDEACRILGDAQLRSKPIYCHCRAGKSRSVTIVLAYLVHRNHWSLKRAYAHVSERRKGISPNIGFVAELMRFEERERGGKSHGVFGVTPALPTSTIAQSASASYFPNPPEVEENASEEEPSRVRGRGRIRDSLPPSRTDGGGVEGEREIEVRGLDGTWAPARQDPKDTNSVPVRRASRAGLESAAGGFTSWGE